MKHLLLILTIFSIFGCSSSSRSVTYYSIDPVVTIKSNHYKNKTIKVLYPKSIKDIVTSNIIYKESKTQENHYRYSRWSTIINKQLLKSIIKALKTSKSFKATLPYSSYANSDFLLECNIYDFYNLLQEGKSYSIISIEFNLIDKDSSKLIKSKKFDYKLLSKTKDAKGYVQATKEAMELMLGDLVGWI